MIGKIRGFTKKGYSRLFFWTFRKKLKADPEKTQAIFPENSSKFVKKLKNLPTKSQFFLNSSVFVIKFSENIAPKLIFFTKLKQIFKNSRYSMINLRTSAKCPG